MARIGRNDPCPCGSGLKYKHCCMKKKGDFIKDGASIHDAIKHIVYEQMDDSTVSSIVFRVQDYLMRKNWIGAGCACTAVLYIALKEAGYDPKLCMGEVSDGRDKIFDHSWVELNGKVIDLACSMTYLEQRVVASPPVVLGINIYSGEPGFLQYGVYKEGLGEESKEILEKSVTEYMDGYPYMVNGLWSIVELVTGIKIKVDQLREKYSDEHFAYIRKED